MNSSEIFNNFNWENFSIDDIFNIESNIDLPSAYNVTGSTMYISASEYNNGNEYTITPPKNHKIYNNKITIVRTGKPGITFYHDYKFSTSGSVRILSLKTKKLNKYIATFLNTSLEKLQYKYSYGKKLGTIRLKAERIWLPITDDNTIDWDNIELYIKTLESEIKPEINEIKTSDEIDLESKTWKEFIINNIFNISSSNGPIKQTKVSGNIPYITGSTFNNGIDDYITNDSNYKEFNNTITIAKDGTCNGEAFYHPYKFIINSHALILDTKNKTNKYQKLFLITSLNKLSKKYSYGMALSQTRLKAETIWLPVTDEGQPDYQFMEDYIKSISFSEILD